MIKVISKQGIILAIAAFISTFLVVLTYSLTKGTIEEQKQAQRLQLLNEVIPRSLHDNVLTEHCTLIENAALGTEPLPVYIAKLNNNVSAMAIEAIAPDGYSGKIRILLAANNQNQILGVRVLEHNETPGLGDKVDIRISDWISSFIGKTLESESDPQWAVKKDGGIFDQFTGATITPRAVIKASQKALWYLQNHKEQILAQELNCEANQ